MDEPRPTLAYARPDHATGHARRRWGDFSLAAAALVVACTLAGCAGITAAVGGRPGWQDVGGVLYMSFWPMLLVSPFLLIPLSIRRERPTRLAMTAVLVAGLSGVWFAAFYVVAAAVAAC